MCHTWFYALPQLEPQWKVSYFHAIPPQYSSNLAYDATLEARSYLVPAKEKKQNNINKDL